jgi:Family of unknown function (DUF6011)
MEDTNMNTYRKIGPGQWGIQSDELHVVGATVSVTLRSGASKSVTLGAHIGTQYGKNVYEIVAQQEQQNGASKNVGDLSGILALFERAKAHLKFPAIVLGVPALGTDFAIRINVAGSRAKVPGSLTVLDADKGDDGREWFGRVLLDSTYQAKAGTAPAIADRLREFAADPVKIAGDHGRLTGRCCFCNIRLSDPRSTVVGYGRICADHFGLPWGSDKHAFAPVQTEVGARSLMEMAKALEMRS